MLLGGLALVAIANGVLLGLSLYGLLAAAVRLIHGQLPPLGYAWLFGIVAGVALLVMALQRERSLREDEYGLWTSPAEESSNAPLVGRFQALIDASTLTRAPALWSVESPEPNAFAVGRSRNDASIVVTSALFERLEPAEQDAVLAHEVASVEAEGLKAVGLADALVDSIAELTRVKGRFLWGPREIVADMLPFLGVCFGITVFASVQPRGEGDVVATLLIAALSLGLLIALVRTALMSWRGVAQLFLLITFFGPLSLVEMVLTPPTAAFLSRLVSRSRIKEADRRGVELTGNPAALVSALEKLADVERSPTDDLLGYRFSLFVFSRPQTGYQAWLARIYATHPSISSRIEAIRELDQVGASTSTSGSRSC